MLAVHSPTVPPPLAWAGVTAPLKRAACWAHCGRVFWRVSDISLMEREALV
jgi:hypothetical protein